MKNDRPFLLVLAVALVVAFSIMAVGYHKLVNAQSQAHRALCAQKQSWTERRDSTIKFLKTHPEGAPSLGLTAAVLARSVKTAQQQIDALGDVKGCES